MATVTQEEKYRACPNCCEPVHGELCYSCGEDVPIDEYDEICPVCNEWYNGRTCYSCGYEVNKEAKKAEDVKPEMTKPKEETTMINEFLNQMNAAGKSALTLRQYKSTWARFVKFVGEESAAISASVLDIADFKRIMEKGGKDKPFDKPFAPRTVQQTLIQLAVIFDFFVEKSVILSNPVRETNTEVIVQQTAPKWLTRNEMNNLLRLVNKFGNLRESTIITFLLNTGLRVQELCDLKLSDITLSERKGEIVVRGKGSKTRTVPLNARARKAISDYLAEHTPKGEYLFDTKRSKKMTARAVQHMIEKYAKLMDKLDLTAHTLRHTFCHNLVKAGVPLDQIAELAGHMKKDGSPNLAMTVRYTQPDANDKAEAVETISW